MSGELKGKSITDDESKMKADLDSWQVREIRKGLAEADRGEFASKREVRRVARKWNPNGESRAEAP